MEMGKTFSAKEEQQIYLGASIASGCRPCTKYHLKRSSEAGLTDVEIEKAIAFVISIRDNVTRSMESFVQNLNKGEIIEEVILESLNRSNIVLGIAATYSANFPSGLKTYLSLAIDNGLSSKKCNEVIALAKSIICKARAHTDMVSDRMGIVQQGENRAETDCCNNGICK